MVNYFLVGLANRRAEITRRGTKRPLRCIGQRESRYAEGKDRENWTCSRLIFFSFFFYWYLIAFATYVQATRPCTLFMDIDTVPSPTVYIGCYRNGKFATLWKYRVTGLFLHAYVRFFFFFSVCQWHGNNECYDWVKRSIEISVCFDL